MIPLSVPNLSEAEEKAMSEMLRSGWVSTSGPQVSEFEMQIAAFTGSPFAVAFNSDTSALHIALLVS